MKILKSLNKENFLTLFFLFFTSIASAEEKPVDIWNIDKKEIEEKKITNNSEISNGENIDSLDVNQETPLHLYRRCFLSRSCRCHHSSCRHMFNRAR